MKVKDIKTGKINEVNDAYGARLIEQGKAVAEKQDAEEKPKEDPKTEPKAEPKETDTAEDPKPKTKPKENAKAHKGDAK